MPGYGILGPTEGRGLLSWSWAEERLMANRNYWLSTVSAANRPHTMAVWGIWHSDSFFFSTGAESRKARNIQNNPWCTLSTEGAAEAVIVEGKATLHAVDASLLKEVAKRYEAKYAMGYPADSHVYQVQPEVVFGFIENASEFSGAATRWQAIR
jgi:hypothetical protein